MCGVFGAYSLDGGNVAEYVYLGIYSLQHRGQESAGMASWDGEKIISCRKMGLVHDAIDQQAVASQKSFCAIGHVRYSTTGESNALNIQPLVASYARGEMALAHNGNIVNAKALRQEMEGRGAIFQSTTDSEIVFHLMAHQPFMPPVDALISSLVRLHGSYSIAMLLGERLIAVRDPWGFRPLCIGRKGDIWFVSSESCALDIVGARFERDVEPGEIVIIDRQGLKSLRLPMKAKRGCLCSFEFVYFARPDSVIDGRDVYMSRVMMGHLLGKRFPVDADIVTGLPDSGTPAALGFAAELGIPYHKAIVRNRLVGRTFIQPTQLVRELGVRMKLNPIRSLINGKRIVAVDDSIVRGTTAGRVVRWLREAGAREVHLRIASPPVRFPCYYGIDTPSSEELAAAKMDMEHLKNSVDADTLEYLPVEDLREAIGISSDRMCAACFNGDYLR